MTWNDIEAKWAAMARRVGSDVTLNNDDTVITRAPKPPTPASLITEPTEMSAPLPLDRPAA